MSTNTTTDRERVANLLDRLAGVTEALTQASATLDEPGTQPAPPPPPPAAPVAPKRESKRERRNRSKGKGTVTQLPTPPAPEPAEEPTYQIKNPDAESTFKQKVKIMSIGTVNGHKPVMLGKEGSDIREFWSFLTKQEASDAISTLLEPASFTFSNGVTIDPK